MCVVSRLGLPSVQLARGKEQASRTFAGESSNDVQERASRTFAGESSNDVQERASSSREEPSSCSEDEWKEWRLADFCGRLDEAAAEQVEQRARFESFAVQVGQMLDNLLAEYG